MDIFRLVKEHDSNTENLFSGKISQFVEVQRIYSRVSLDSPNEKDRRRNSSVGKGVRALPFNCCCGPSRDLYIRARCTAEVILSAVRAAKRRGVRGEKVVEEHFWEERDVGIVKRDFPPRRITGMSAEWLMWDVSAHKQLREMGGTEKRERANIQMRRQGTGW